MKGHQDISQGLPEEFLKKMQGILGEEYDEFLASFDQLPAIGIRVNTLKLSPIDFINISPYQLTPTPWCISGFTVDRLTTEVGSIPPGKHPYHSAGLFYLQDPSAMAAGEVLSPQPGEKVLDLAAAPGGKSTHLAGLMKNTGLLVANEIHPGRVWDLAENLERCGVTNVVVTNETPVRLAEHFGNYFDRIMLDAPCSGEGMFRKNMNARKEWNSGLPHSCSIRQNAILDHAARLVKPGGCIVYTTCTFSPEENEGLIARFLERHHEFDLQGLEPVTGLQPSKPEWIGLPPDHKLSRALRIWPHKSIGEGHFMALLIRNGSQDDLTINPRKLGTLPKQTGQGKISSSIRNIMDDFSNENLTISFDYQQIHVEGTYIYRIPEGTPHIAGLKVIHHGWWLGSIHKNRFIPSHALAIGLHPDQVRQIIPLHLGDQQISAYLIGESFVYPGQDGWVLVTVDGYPLGWGKRVQNVVKNYYPHGLRRSF